MQTEGIDITSVGNTNTLQESTLVEAFNLRAAIEFILKNCVYKFYFKTNQKNKFLLF